MTKVEGDPKAPFSLATTLRCREECYSFPWIASLYPWYAPNYAKCKEASSTIFWVFGMTQPGIEPRSLGSLANIFIFNSVFKQRTELFEIELFGNLIVCKQKIILLLKGIFIIKAFRTIVFIFIVIFKTFRPICPPAFFGCLSNSGTYTELRTTSFIESTGSPVLIP